ncbi:MAG: hypothetical protein AB7F90_11715 [Nitrospirales bacterium]
MANFMNPGYLKKFRIRAVFSLFVLVVLISSQIAGGAWVWALDNTVGMGTNTSRTTPLIAGLRGEVTLFQSTNQGHGSVPHYRQTMGIGDVISTGEESVAEILFPYGTGLVTVQEFSEASLENDGAGHLVLNMKVGEGEISSPLKDQGENRFLLIQTPNLVAKTSGGLVTMEVKSTLAQTVSPASTYTPYIHRTSLHSQATASSNTVLSEKFCVKEGSLEIDSQKNSAGQKSLHVSAGQCVGFLNGTLSVAPERTQLTDWRAVCAVNPHCEIPESIKQLIAKKQMGQALALERALVGSEKSDADIDEQVILATTGLTLAAASQIITPPGNPVGDPFNPCLTDPNACQEPLPPAPGGNPVNEPPLVGGGGGGGGNPNPGNIQNAGSLIPPQGVAGGQGALLYTNSDFLATKELFLVDNNANPNTSPHKGKVPQSSLVISTLTPTPAFNNVTPTNEFIPPVFPSFPQGPTTDVQLGIEGGTREQVLQQLAYWLRSPSIDPDTPLQGITVNGAGVNCSTILNCAELIWALGQNGTFQFPGFDAGVDGTIQASSAGSQITLKHGATLVNTHVDISGVSTVGQPTKTSQFFSQLNPSLGNQLDGSLVSILGNPGMPAKVVMEDRLLGILANSHIQPQNSNLSTSLVAILDSELKGPVAQPVIGKDSNGQDIVRSDIPSLVEIMDSTVEVENGVVVASTASSGQNGVLDQALLEASSPLLAMIRASFETASDFGRVAGQNSKLVANLVSGDSLIRVDASSFTVNGNLFSVTGGGQFLVAGGSLLSVQGNSTVNLNNGVFVSVGPGSLFSLTGGGLVNFGTGQNVVNVTNNLCSGGGCFAPFSNPTWQVAGDPSGFSAAAGANPFVDLGNFADGSVNTLNIAPGSAILQVQPGGTIQIQ